MTAILHMKALSGDGPECLLKTNLHHTPADMKPKFIKILSSYLQLEAMSAVFCKFQKIELYLLKQINRSINRLG